MPKKEYDEYYNRLEYFFLYLEKKYKLKVIIAAHPLIAENGFKDRKIFKNQTPKLIRNAEFVIGVTSSALMYPVLLNKKIILIYSEILNKLLGTALNIEVWKKLFGINYLSIDNSQFMKNEILTIDYNKRKILIKNLALDLSNFYFYPYNYIKDKYFKN